MAVAPPRVTRHRILQDWFAVCEGDPMVPGDIAVPESLRVYCPGS